MLEDYDTDTAFLAIPLTPRPSGEFCLDVKGIGCPLPKSSKICNQNSKIF